MAFWMRGVIDPDFVLSQLQKILSPYTVALNDDLDDLSEAVWQATDLLLNYGQQPSSQYLWTCFELVKPLDYAFEIEEYLADQLNQQNDLVTVAECYRLMSSNLRGHPESSYYSILFDENHRVILVDNVDVNHTEALDFLPLAYFDAQQDDKLLNKQYQIHRIDELCYLGSVFDGQFHPIIQANYQHFTRSDLSEFLK